MATRHRQRFVIGQTVWMVVALVALALLNTLTLEVYFVVSLIGLLVVTELTAPFNITPRWRSRLRWILLCGVVVFGLLIARRLFRLLDAVL